MLAKTSVRHAHFSSIFEESKLTSNLLKRLLVIISLQKILRVVHKPLLFETLKNSLRF